MEAINTNRSEGTLLSVFVGSHKRCSGPPNVIFGQLFNSSVQEPNDAMLLSLAVAGIAGAILEMLRDRRTGDKLQTLGYSVLGKYSSGPLSKVLSVLLELNFSCSKNSGLEPWLSGSYSG